jgi:hypothetical protein
MQDRDKMKVVVITHRGEYESVYIDGKLITDEIEHDTHFEGYDYKRKYSLEG